MTHTKYSWMTEEELLRMVTDKSTDLERELCARLMDLMDLVEELGGDNAAGDEHAFVLRSGTA